MADGFDDYVREEEFDKTQHLQKLLTKNQIEELYQIFENAEGKKFNPHQLRRVLENFDLTFTDEEYERLFLKINTNRDSLCDWDEFVSHLILGFQEDDPYNQNESLILPIQRPPILKRAIHRHSILRVSYCPTVLPNRSLNLSSGSYVTTSKDGAINFWTSDFQLVRSGKSKNPFLKVAQTWILDCVGLPDVRIVCTSSTERDLRFYDTTANNFHLRIIITTLPWAVNTMSYYFAKSLDVECKLVAGDCGGNIKIFTFNPELRGPFQSNTGTGLITLPYSEVFRGKLPGMKVMELANLHVDKIRQIDYDESTNSVISAAECPATPNLTLSGAGIMICSLSITQKKTTIKVNKGITCFWYEPTLNILATGGPDCILRLWNPIMPQKASAILPGHHAGIKYVFIQPDENKVYSVDKNKIVKVWDIREQNILQTYISFTTNFPDHTFVAFYNSYTRDLVLAGMNIGITKCCPLLRLDLTDGDTHARPVSVVLYNKLFKTIVTCGYDSIIIVWDVWTGKRLTLITMAHTRMMHGEILRVQITAACFDPKHQLLLTGARDGTLKIWNFNNGFCTRNLSIEPMCEVTSVFWVPNRILASGWNRHVIEFADAGETEYGDGKSWDICHIEDILAASVKSPETLATSSYCGELILWKLETGQPYRRYNVANPTTRIKIVYEGQKFQSPDINEQLASEPEFPRQSLMQGRKTKLKGSRKYSLLPVKTPRNSLFRSTRLSLIATAPSRAPRKVSIIKLPEEDVKERPPAVQACYFLKTRPMSVEYGTLFVSLETGVIQVYSHHRMGGYMTHFNAIHMAGDCIVTMISDKEDRYLITGSVLGYIKIFLVVNYCVPESAKQHINKPLLRLSFPFLLKDFFDGRAKRTARGQEPMLINSFKAHLSAIKTLAYIDETEMILSGSGDTSVRLWTLSGRYIGTLGSPKKWAKLSPVTPVPTDYNFRIPPDLKPVVSFTTLKVLKGGAIEQTVVREEKTMQSTNFNEESKKYIYGKPLVKPILGKHLALPPHPKHRVKPTFDKSLPYIPVYSHLDVHEVTIIQRPATPEALKRLKHSEGTGEDTEKGGKSFKFNIK